MSLPRDKSLLALAMRAEDFAVTILSPPESGMFTNQVYRRGSGNGAKLLDDAAPGRWLADGERCRMDLWRRRPLEMKRKSTRKQKHTAAKSVLRLPDLEVAKSAVLNSLSCPDAQRGYRHAIDEFVE